MGTPRPRAWSLLSILEPQHGGNEGYDDNTATHYSYDSTVSNHRYVSKGDLAVIRDGTQLLGVGIISSITCSKGMKKRLRCPECRKTGFKPRTTKLPVFRCDRGHTFDTPTEEMISVDKYRADYGETWTPLRNILSAEALEEFIPSAARMHSIREVDVQRLRATLGRSVPDRIWKMISDVESNS